MYARARERLRACVLYGESGHTRFTFAYRLPISSAARWWAP